MALLIEHHKGKWPFWLNPRQVIILTLNDKKETLDFAREAKEIIQTSKSSKWPREVLYGETPAGFPIPSVMIGRNLNVKIDDSARSLPKKIIEAKAKGYGVIAVIGIKMLGLSS